MNQNELEEEIRAALNEVLPKELHSTSNQLARLLLYFGEGNLSPERVRAIVKNNPALQEILVLLKGQSISTTNSVLSFGADNQLGDQSIGNVAGGNIINITIHHYQSNDPPPLTALTRRKESDSINQGARLFTDFGETVSDSIKSTTNIVNQRIADVEIATRSKINQGTSLFQSNQKAHDNTFIYKDYFIEITETKVQFQRTSYKTDNILGASILEKTPNRLLWNIMAVLSIITSFIVSAIFSDSGLVTEFVLALGLVACYIILKHLKTERYILKLDLLSKYVEVRLPKNQEYAEIILDKISLAIGATAKNAQ